MSKHLDALRAPPPGTAIDFSLQRYGARRPLQWRYDGLHHFVEGADSLAASPDLVDALDHFVEAIEADARPSEPVPAGFEVWRFVHGSTGAAPDTTSLASHLEAVLDETFNAPSLYDSRDLRRR